MAGFLFLYAAILGSAQEPTPTAIAHASRAQIGKTVRYDPAYRALAYPNGDVPIEVGVCSDVVVRALRTAYGIDLQRLVHEDMRRAFAEYPQNWGLKRPDKNIDHRRVPNLSTYFKRRGFALPVSRSAQDYLPGDLVVCTVPPNLPHIMIVSDRGNENGRPLVVHNIGAGTQEEDRLFEFSISGHYRIASIEGARIPNAGRRTSFRLRGKVFASLGYPDDASAMVKLTPEQQTDSLLAAPNVFAPCAGAWGRQGSTSIHLPSATAEVVQPALEASWRNLSANRRMAATKA